MMFLPCDGILLPIIVIGVFVYYALESLFTPSEKKDDRPWSEIAREIQESEAQKKEVRRYQKWLEEHQQ